MTTTLADIYKTVDKDVWRAKLEDEQSLCLVHKTQPGRVVTVQDDRHGNVTVESQMGCVRIPSIAKAQRVVHVATMNSHILRDMYANVIPAQHDAFAHDQNTLVDPKQRLVFFVHHDDDDDDDDIVNVQAAIPATTNGPELQIDTNVTLTIAHADANKCYQLAQRLFQIGRAHV